MPRTVTCPHCGHVYREDRKSINQWMAKAIRALAHLPQGTIIHAATFLRTTCPDGARGHDYALLRHWGLLAPLPRPADAPREHKGSRGLSGYYRVTDLGREFAYGRVKVPSTIVREPGATSYVVDPECDDISIYDALRANLLTVDNQIADGTTI